jgi:hypothetical protein
MFKNSGSGLCCTVHCIMKFVGVAGLCSVQNTEALRCGTTVQYGTVYKGVGVYRDVQCTLY